jgi:hypothetical protein
MHEALPFILIILGWHPSDPAKSMAVQHRLFASEAECRLHGNEYVEQRKIYATEFGNARFHYECIPAPTQAELAEAFENAE